MKSIKFFCVLVCTLMFFAVACREESENESTDKKQEKSLIKTIGENSDDRKFEIGVTDVTDEGLTITLKNNSDSLYSYGESFTIYDFASEKELGHVELENGMEFCFSEVEYFLEPGKNVEISCEWKALYGKLPKGKYIITKNILLLKNKDDRYIDEFVVGTQFEIE